MSTGDMHARHPGTLRAGVTAARRYPLPILIVPGLAGGLAARYGFTPVILHALRAR